MGRRGAAGCVLGVLEREEGEKRPFMLQSARKNLVNFLVKLMGLCFLSKIGKEATVYMGHPGSRFPCGLFQNILLNLYL